MQSKNMQLIAEIGGANSGINDIDKHSDNQKKQKRKARKKPEKENSSEQYCAPMSVNYV